ncbi:MAG: CHY zinc finger protein [Acidobacteriaceae bacterium]
MGREVDDGQEFAGVGAEVWEGLAQGYWRWLCCGGKEARGCAREWVGETEGFWWRHGVCRLPESAGLCCDREVTVYGQIVEGIEVDGVTRCAHYHSEIDIIAIKMACCGTYYACKECHEALAGHALVPWPKEQWETRAVLCGGCGYELAITEYLQSGYRCPRCGAGFNPGCRNHAASYFAGES